MRACPPKSPISERPLLSLSTAHELENLFKAVANSTRLRLIHALIKDEELSVGSLCDALKMRPQALSNQLQRLTEHGIVNFRREGQRVLYRIANPCVPKILERGWCLSEEPSKYHRALVRGK